MPRRQRIVPADRLTAALKQGAIDSWDRETGWRIPVVYYSSAGPPPPQPDAGGWTVGSNSLDYPLDLDEVELLRAEVEALVDPPREPVTLDEAVRVELTLDTRPLPLFYENVRERCGKPRVYDPTKAFGYGDETIRKMRQKELRKRRTASQIRVSR